MPGTRFKNRHRLSRKEARSLQEQFIGSLGFSPVLSEDSLDVAETEKHSVVLEGNTVVGFFKNDRLFPTVRCLLRAPPDKRYVTVDMGAVKFVASGADVMAPGIVDVDRMIREGDTVWVRDERNGRPIAVGIALRSGDEMLADKKGKAVKNVHHAGDDIWDIG
ncbi:MAG: RNA-binding protein [Thermoplasmata archaeon]